MRGRDHDAGLAAEVQDPEGDHGGGDGAVGEHGVVLRLNNRAGDLREAVEGVLTEHVLGAAGEQGRGGGVDVGEAPVAVEPVDGVGHRGQRVDRGDVLGLRV